MLLSLRLRFLVTVAVLFGLVVGSFLNVVIHRLPKMMERQWRAECAELAGTPAPAAEPALQPRGAALRLPALRPRHHARWRTSRSRAISRWAASAPPAASRISLRYPVVEALAGALSGYIAWRLRTLAPPCRRADLRVGDGRARLHRPRYLLSARQHHPAPAVGRAAVQYRRRVFTDLRSAIIGAVAGYLALWSVYWVFKLATGKEGMGYGDFKLLAAIGAWLGWKMLPLVILLSSLVGAVVGIAPDRVRAPRTQRADSLRSLSRRGRPDRAVLGRAA